MAKATKTQEEIRMENVEATLSASDKFYNEHKKTIWGVIIAVVVIGAGVLAYSKFVYEPACKEAAAQTFSAEAAFQAGEFQVALDGDGNNLGFAEVVSTYGAKAGKAVYLYAGTCEYQLGNYESALSYLKKYKGGEAILAARAISLQGDCYVNLGNNAAAAKCFVKAAAKADNVFAAAYLVKAGLAYEALGNKGAALEQYNKVKDSYPQSIEAYDIDKHINRVK